MVIADCLQRTAHSPGQPSPKIYIQQFRELKGQCHKKSGLSYLRPWKAALS